MKDGEREGGRKAGGVYSEISNYGPLIPTQLDKAWPTIKAATTREATYGWHMLSRTPQRCGCRDKVYPHIYTSRFVAFRAHRNQHGTETQGGSKTNEPTG